MTPTSPLAGLLTGLVDGSVVALLIMLVLVFNNRRHRVAPTRIRQLEQRAAERPAERSDERSDETASGPLHRAA